MGSSLQCRLVRNVSFAQRSGSTWRRHMHRKRASDFPQELLDLFDGYVHGGISRRQFLDKAQKFAVAGATATSLFQDAKAELCMGDTNSAGRQADQSRGG